MNTFLAGLVSWVLVPVAVAKGLGVRRIVPRLPPPRGRPMGQVGQGSAEIRILVVGDSSAAGVGADRIEDTLGPQLAAILGKSTGKTVAWRNAGANSAIAAQVRDHMVPHIEERDFTHVILAVGTNDAKNFVTRSAFKKGFGGLLYALHARWPEASVYWSPVVAMADVPALPPSLAYILGLRAQIINAIGTQLCRERTATPLDPLPIEGAEGFAIDGFHANALGYRHWAEHIARIILAETPAPSSSQKSE
ncbi:MULTISPECIES: SGNH/GDSL hydrolase family protein [Hoeflea]|uniref:SGNH/GDSL hydrolase family protein n=1 Tax=Hoeflea alexandrii TaxID=288436 RepID=A0ABT1CKX0_9HYPH|nr:MULTISPECIES: SGNH/GDSL hydrolase family protein [Hoeflea]MCO6406849.1 SGNH/GDSL hydrolase family protein [Hoeflea alexandrii]MCY0154690.1 SGNH/GDSL hydrolase family protein [Hoeflea alexandrii]VVT01912.1 G-D-S-L family lipolytic protein [Hoeflea sp. EC-HK425]